MISRDGRDGVDVGGQVYVNCIILCSFFFQGKAIHLLIVASDFSAFRGSSPYK